MKHREELCERAKQYRAKNKQWVNQKQRQKYWLDVEKSRAASRKYYWKDVEHSRKYCREYRRNNPGSSRTFSLDLQLSMNNVRKRDNNTCQWAGCNLTHREAPIHVHHIFPRSEHPELELVEQYMICYCANHHGIWHRYRGDEKAHFLSKLMENN